MEFDKNRLAQARHRMVEEQLVQRGIRNHRVLDVLRAVPRHLFVPREYWEHAYADMPLPIGAGQTISQPYIVAYMTAALRLRPTDRVLEIGTGSGYQAAILGRLTRKVVTVEYIDELAQAAKVRINKMGIENVEVCKGDGGQGWPEHAPYDAILVPAASPRVPQPLLEQLATAGRMVLPIGSRKDQHLQLWTRHEGRNRRQVLAPVRFVPLVGRWGWKEVDRSEKIL